MLATWAIRPAAPGDYDAFVSFLAELGLPDDPVPDRARWEAAWLPITFFVERDGVAAGYGVLRTLGDLAHVLHVVTHPAHRGLGVGRALMEEMARRARAAGCSRWALNVKVDNAPAIRLYERCGLRAAYRSAGMRLAWALVPRLPREEGPISARVVDPAEDAAIEAAFAIPSGNLAEVRRGPGKVILRLVDAARPDDPRVGVACFDPAFPGVFPLRVARPTLAAPLLDALRPHARPEHLAVRLMVEDDEPLVSALVAAGGEVMLEILHMESDLPAAEGR